MTYILGDHPNTDGKRLTVAVEEASDRSYIDITVTNGRGQIATVTLKMDDGGNLVVHAEDRTTPHVPDTLDPSCPVDDIVIVAGAFDAAPLGDEDE